MNGRLALFDLDGTLVDSAPDIADAVGLALRTVGRTPPGEALVRDYIGNGAARLIHRALTGALEKDAEPALFEAAYAAFLEAYAERLFERSSLYPGVSDTLDRLTADGWAMAVVTNKPARFTVPLLARAGLAPYFGAVVSGDSLAEKKPHPAPLRHAAAGCGIDIGRGVMIGDSLADVNAAHGAGIPAICVDYGYARGADFDACGVHAVISSLRELPPLLGRLPA